MIRHKPERERLFYSICRIVTIRTCTLYFCTLLGNITLLPVQWPQHTHAHTQCNCAASLNKSLFKTFMNNPTLKLVYNNYLMKLWKLLNYESHLKRHFPTLRAPTPGEVVQRRPCFLKTWSILPCCWLNMPKSHVF